MYWILAAAAARIAATSGIRIGHLIGRNRHGIDAADQLGRLRFLISGDESVLSRLRSLEFQALVFSRQSSNLVLGQEVQDCAAVGVGVVDDIPGGVLDGVSGIAGLGRHVVAYALNGILDAVGLGGQIVIHAVHRPLGLAAAILSLSGHIAHLRLDTVEALKQSHIGVVEAAGNAVVQGISAVTDALLDSRDAALHTVEGNGLVYICAGGKALESGISAGTATTEASTGVQIPA